MRVAIVTTGGTIDKDYFDALSEYQVVESPILDLLSSYHLDIDFTLVHLLQKDSLELTDKDRRLIQQTVLGLEHDKVLITHGTDTMAETAKGLMDIPGKTIVLTGAMKPARFKESDAVFNIGFALGVLSSRQQGTYLAMSGRAFAPDKVRKNRDKACFEAID